MKLFITFAFKLYSLNKKISKSFDIFFDIVYIYRYFEKFEYFDFQVYFIV